MYLGSFAIDDTCTFTVNTHTPSTGAAVDADAVPSYRVYEDETTAPILTGNMALLDDANTTGYYSEKITLSAANGFEYGKSYTIRIAAVVGGVTGVCERHLSMGAKVNTTHVGGTVQTGADVGAIVAKFAGITLLGNWLRALARKDAADATALSEINSGGGAYTETTDALEGLADKTSGLTAQETANALKLAPDSGAAAAGSVYASIAGVPAAVWASSVRTLTSFGTLVAEVGAYVLRVMSQVGAIVPRPGLTTDMVLYRHADTVVQITGLGNLSDREALYVSVKASKDDLDTEALLRVEETDGLVWLDGAAAVTDTDATLTVTDATDGAVTLTVKQAATGALSETLRGLVYDVKKITSTGPQPSLREGVARLEDSVTRAVS